MKRATTFLPLLIIALLTAFAPRAAAQTTGTISGTVQDEKGAAISGATTTARNVETNVARTSQTDADGRYRFGGMQVGHYEITVEATSFSKYVQTGVQLLLNQDAVVDVTMRPAGVEAVVTVTENAALLNTTNAEVSTRFDERRLSELPLSTNRNVFNVALSAPGVSQLGSSVRSRPSRRRSLRDSTRRRLRAPSLPEISTRPSTTSSASRCSAS
ncbi:MAG: hypothetical protein QOJ70_1513 [Acidobacteriota bacterium]|jgi:hypothetical protein|nr:hypothetical protein [Acidobacteriota bacterium]